jgi:hypothetical protein
MWPWVNPKPMVINKIKQISNNKIIYSFLNPKVSLYGGNKTMMFGKFWLGMQGLQNVMLP